MKKILAILATIGLLSVLYAGQYDGYTNYAGYNNSPTDRGSYQEHQEQRYQGYADDGYSESVRNYDSAEEDYNTIPQHIIKVRVTKTIPQYRRIVKKVPYQECWDEKVPVKNSDGTVGGIIGGVAGGILGHQVGGGSGKTAATVGGAIIGTLVGNNLSSGTKSDNMVTSYKTVRRCKKRYNTSAHTIITGYENIGYINGEKVVSYTPKKERYIKVKIVYEVLQ